MGKTFSTAELAAAFATFEQTVDRAAQTKDWDVWVEHYTPDVDYIEHAAGTMKGREQVRAWIWKTMTAFPGSYMTAFPSLWSVIDEPTGRIICELDNPMVDPVTGPSSAPPTSRSSPTPVTGCGRGKRTSTTRCDSWPRA